MKNFNASFTEAASKEARIERFNITCDIIATEFPNFQKSFSTSLEIEYSKANIGLIKAQLAKFYNQSKSFCTFVNNAFDMTATMSIAGELSKDHHLKSVVKVYSLWALVGSLLRKVVEFIKKPSKKLYVLLRGLVNDSDKVYKSL